MPPIPAALVTGGARRIGAAIVRALAEGKTHVYFTYRSSEAEARTLEADIRERGGKTTALPCDVENPQSVGALFEEIRKRHPRLDTLINNASCFVPSPKNEWSAERWDQALNTNARGPFLCVQNALPLMHAGGNIINLLDLTALKPRADYLTHGVSKAALQALTRALALELGPAIRVNAVCPGAMLPPVGVDKDALRERTDQTALKSWGGEAPVVRTILHLLENTYITGETIHVDGGASLY